MTSGALPTPSFQHARMDHQASRALSLWHRARQSLPSETQNLIDFQQIDQADILEDVLQIAEAKRKECLRKRWKIKRSNGDLIVLRDVFEKIASFALRFREIGDVAIQYDPGHAALPWAGVRFLLQVVINETSTFAALVDGLEYVTNCMSRYAIIEAIYLREPSLPSENLANSLVEVYASILTFLGKSIAYFDTRAVKRYLKGSLGTTESTISQMIADITKKQWKVEQDSLLVQGFRQLGLVDITHSLIGQVNKTTVKPDPVGLDLYHSWMSDNAKVRTDIARLIRIASDLTIPVHRISQTLQDLEVTKTEAGKLTLLKWASTVPVDQHHYNVRKDRVPFTGQWLFDKPKFKDWRISSCSSILWVHGIPGSGKTVLTSSLIDYLCEENDDDELYSPPIAFFYCSRNVAEPERAKPLEVLASILRQLSGDRHHCSIRKPLREAYETVKNRGFEARRMGLNEIVNVIVQLNETSPSVIIIDALDECDPTTRYELLESLDEILTRSENVIKVFVTSRSDHDIECRLKNVPNIYIQAEDNQADIARFIEVEVSRAVDKKRLLCGQVSNDLHTKINQTLTHGAQGMFRWVSLQIQNLCDPRRMKIEADVTKELGHMPKTLSDMYDVIFDQILQSGQTSATLARIALQWMMAARRQLSPSELAAGIVTSHADTTVKLEPEHVIRITCNFLVVDEFLDTVRFAHVSAREYLETRPGFSQAECDMQVGLGCLNFYKIQCHVDTQIERDLKSDDLRSYASSYWPSHASRTEKSNQRQVLITALHEVILDSQWISTSFMIWRRDVDGADHSTDIHLKACITPLHTCCLFGFWEVLEGYGRSAVQKYNFAFQDKTKINSDHGKNGLHMAICHGSYMTVKLMLEFGADATELTMTEMTPIYLAVVQNHDHLISLLASHGADLNQAVPYIDIHQMPSGVKYVDRHHLGHPGHVTQIRSNPTRLGLRGTNGRITSAIDEEGETPIHHAASCGYVNAISSLAQNGADIDVVNNIGSTPLMKALEVARPEVVECLIRHGANVDKELVHGRTALHLAAASGNYRAVRLLLNAGADPVRQDWLGSTASDLARRFQHDEIVNILPSPTTRPFSDHDIDEDGEETASLVQNASSYSEGPQIVIEEWERLLQTTQRRRVLAPSMTIRRRPLPNDKVTASSNTIADGQD